MKKIIEKINCSLCGKEITDKCLEPVYFLGLNCFICQDCISAKAEQRLKDFKKCPMCSGTGAKKGKELSMQNCSGCGGKGYVKRYIEI